jgi:hypothetical protein
MVWLGLVWFMVFNATFNNISVISWRSVLLVEKTTDLSQVTDKLFKSGRKVQEYSQYEALKRSSKIEFRRSEHFFHVLDVLIRLFRIHIYIYIEASLRFIVLQLSLSILIYILRILNKK